VTPTNVFVCRMYSGVVNTAHAGSAVRRFSASLSRSRAVQLLVTTSPRNLGMFEFGLHDALQAHGLSG
jgi:hypothetical protein